MKKKRLSAYSNPQLKGEDAADEQQSKMNEIMQNRKLANKTEQREREIAALRQELKKQRMKTFPRFNPMPDTGAPR